MDPGFLEDTPVEAMSTGASVPTIIVKNACYATAMFWDGGTFQTPLAAD